MNSVVHNLMSEFTLSVTKMLLLILTWPHLFSSTQGFGFRYSTEGKRQTDPPGQGPLQPAVGDPASSGGLD